MGMAIPVKKGKGKCPHCGKWVKLIYNEIMDLMVLECCKKYSLYKGLDKKG